MSKFDGKIVANQLNALKEGLLAGGVTGFGSYNEASVEASYAINKFNEFFSMLSEEAKQQLFSYKNLGAFLSRLTQKTPNIESIISETSYIDSILKADFLSFDKHAELEQASSRYEQFLKRFKESYSNTFILTKEPQVGKAQDVFHVFSMLAKSPTLSERCLKHDNIRTYLKNCVDDPKFLSKILSSYQKGSLQLFIDAGYPVQNLAIQLMAASRSLPDNELNSLWLQDWILQSYELKKLIQWAIKNKKSYLLKMLYQTDPRLFDGYESKNKDRCSFLHMLVEKDDKDTIQLLIKCGMLEMLYQTDPQVFQGYESKNKGYCNFLQMLVEKDDKDTIQLLIKYGMLKMLYQTDPQLFEGFESKNKNRCNFLHILVETGDIDTVKKCVINCGMKTDVVDDQGNTLLIHAGSTLTYNDSMTMYLGNTTWHAGSIKFCKYLIECNPALINQPNLKGQTPLLAFAINKPCWIPLIEFLLTQGANVDIRDSQGLTILDLALEHDYELALFLLDKDIDFNKELASNHLLKFIQNEKIRVVKRLISKNVDTNQCDEEGNTLLMLSITKYHHDELFELLLEKNPALINKQNLKGDTALSLAVVNEWKKRNDKTQRYEREDDYNWIKRIEKLLAKSCALELKNKSGSTSLTLAAAHNLTTIVLKLINAGADLSVNVGSYSNILDWAVKEKHHDIVSVIAKKQQNLLKQPTLAPTNNGFFANKQSTQEGNKQTTLDPAMS